MLQLDCDLQLTCVTICIKKFVQVLNPTVCLFRSFKLESGLRKVLRDFGFYVLKFWPIVLQLSWRFLHRQMICKKTIFILTINENVEPSNNELVSF